MSPTVMSNFEKMTTIEGPWELTRIQGTEAGLATKMAIM